MRVRTGQVRNGKAVVVAATLVASTALGGLAAVGAAPPAAGASPSGCQLGNGVQHVINIVFDNVHFFRDNPNVPSDLEQMPHLLNFLESNGTVSEYVIDGDGSTVLGAGGEVLVSMIGDVQYVNDVAVSVVPSGL